MHPESHTPRAHSETASKPQVSLMDGALEAQRRAKKAARAKHLIDPRTSKYIGYWDLVTGLALLFTALVTPWEVAFAPAPKSALESMFIVNRLVDCIFIVDMAFNFLLMYQVNENSPEGAKWEDDPNVIARKYLCGWFPLDFVSVLPFDVLSIVIGEAVSKLKIIRLIRLMRLIKLVRLLRASRMFKRWEARMSISYGTLALCRCLLQILFGGHWFACAWALQAGFQDDPTRTWMGADDRYCWAVDDWVNDDGYECVPPWSMYSAAIYFAIMTITSIGYGDISARPDNPAEQVCATVLMLCGSMLWGNVIATFCGVMSTLNPDVTEFRQTMDSLNRFMALQELPVEMQRRLREYFHQTKHLQLAAARRALITQMSPALQGEVAMMCNERWLRRVWFLVSAEEDFVVQIALHLSAMVFAPGEVAGSGFLYIIHRGLALYGGQVLGAGRVWGEDMILQSEWLVRKYCARAMNYLEVYMIGRDELVAVADHFPAAAGHLRRCAIRLAVRRQFISVAHEIRAREREARGEAAEGSLLDRMFRDASSKQIPAALFAGLATISSRGDGGAAATPGSSERRPSSGALVSPHAAGSQKNLLAASPPASPDAKGGVARPAEVQLTELNITSHRDHDAVSLGPPAADAAPAAPAAPALASTAAPDALASGDPRIWSQLAAFERRQERMASDMEKLKAGMEILLQRTPTKDDRPVEAAGAAPASVAPAPAEESRESRTMNRISRAPSI